MKTVYYTLQTLLHRRGEPCIKILTLTLGLLMAVFLFARMAFELSYDRCFRQSEHLYRLETSWKEASGGPSLWSAFTLMPVPATLSEAFPEEIEAATVSYSLSADDLWVGNRRHSVSVVLADTCYFRTLGIPLLKGHEADLAAPGVVFLSEKTARKLFAGEEAVGKTVQYKFYSDVSCTCLVRGIYSDLSLNNSLEKQPEAILSLPTLELSGMRTGWGSGGNFEGYVRLTPETNRESMSEERLSSALLRYLPADSGFQIGIKMVLIRSLHLQKSGVRTMLWVLFLLGTVILFATTLNYVLLSVASLVRRAKAVGVHKCCGASGGNIFFLFMTETVVTVLLALLLMGSFVFLFREQVEEWVDVPLSALFSPENLWAPLAVVALLIVVGGGLPALMFARIPVTQVFQRYSSHKKGGKRILLFVQFGCAAVVLGMMLTVLSQYLHLTKRDRGWDEERVAYLFPRGVDATLLQTWVRHQPMVEASASSERPMLGFGGWTAVHDNQGKPLFYPRFNRFDKEFLSFIGMRLKLGRVAETKQEIMVNQQTLEQLGWTDSPLGKHVEGYGIVVGVLESFALVNQPNDYMPIIITGMEKPGTIHVRLKKPFRENLIRLNEVLHADYPQAELNFRSLEDDIKVVYEPTRVFLDVTLWASLSVLFIIFMGMFGYVSDEVRLRSKEIAIRKVNGAEASSILRMVSEDVLWVALSSVLLGIWGAHEAGKVWLTRFTDAMEVSGWYYLLLAVVLLVFIVGCIIGMAWKVANEPPVKSLQSE